MLQLNTWFTNARRRSGWSEVYRIWGGSSPQGMRLLLESLDSPVLDDGRRSAVARVRHYFESVGRDKVGAWVNELLAAPRGTKEVFDRRRCTADRSFTGQIAKKIEYHLSYITSIEH
jgi:hypothetical protein